MVQIRLHGLGGQGVVSTAHLIGKAAMMAGLWANSLPFFTTAQRGGKVTAYTRIDRKRIDQHCYVYEPDILVFFHLSFLKDGEALQGISDQTLILLSAKQEDIQIFGGISNTLWALDAEKIAREILGIPVPSTVMAGAVLRLLPDISLDVMQRAIAGSVSERAVEKNRSAAETGYRTPVLIQQRIN